MTFQEYLSEVHKTYWQHKGQWRRGQCYFNVLYDQRPTLANYIRGSSLDPFYLSTEQECEVFVHWLEAAWKMEEKWDNERNRTAGQGEPDDGS